MGAGRPGSQGTGWRLWEGAWERDGGVGRLWSTAVKVNVGWGCVGARRRLGRARRWGLGAI